MGSSQAEIVDLEMDRLEELLRRVETNTLTADDCATILALLQSYVHLTGLLKDKATSLARLRKLLFGASTEKTSAVVGRPVESESSSSSADMPPDSPAETDATDASAPPRKGHGRNGAAAYTGAERIEVRHESLQPGDDCPQCEEGTLYDTKRPGIIVRLKGQPPVGAKLYVLQKLRCGLCGALFTAAPPEGMGEQKYDATAGSMVALLKYGNGMPFHRSENMHGTLGIPLPASTQWDIVREKAERIEPAFEEMVQQAAQGDVVYNDDTTVKILALMDLRARQAALAESACESSGGKSPTEPGAERTGLFTTGIVSTREGRKIALFLSGRKHAGENLKDVLMRRAEEFGSPIQMCDALSRNLPGELKTILGNCLAHGRRKFVDVVEHFPEECRYVLEALAVVYKNDALARERKLSPQERLEFHQAHSGPVMKELHAWLVRQFEDRQVEPNSGLGKAISHLLKHWEKFTLFLRVAGAPLDNNICERALKRAILHRKNALFYKTPRGARVGDIFMSLIHTCELCGANPFDYLTELDRHDGELASRPQDWMPWNYRQMLAATAGSPSADPS